MKRFNTLFLALSILVMLENTVRIGRVDTVALGCVGLFSLGLSVHYNAETIIKERKDRENKYNRIKNREYF